MVWAAWHMIPLRQAQRPADWIAWWGLGTVCSRVIIVWIYNHAGKSVLAATLYHGMSNLSWQLFPDHGSHYDPRIMALLLIPTVAIITLFGGLRIPRR